LVATLIAASALSWTSAQAQIHVDVNTPAPLAQQDGLGWATAYESLPQGIVTAGGLTAETKKVIWVADGTYYPEVKRDPLDIVGASKSFSLPPNTRLYGGFRGVDGAYGGEDSPNDRKAVNFTRTVLDGLVNGVNVRHVVFCEPAVYTLFGGYLERARVDGFRIVNGRASGTTDEDNRGGGIYAMDTSLIVKNCEFESNVAKEDGGAIYWAWDWDYNSLFGTPCGYDDTGEKMGFGVSESRFRSNVAIDRGGAVYAHLARKIPHVSTPANHVSSTGIPSYVQNCEFLDNQAGLNLDPASTAYQGGGALAFFNPTDVVVNGNVFARNTVHGKGSAVYMDYEWYLRPCDGFQMTGVHPVAFRNNTLYGNTSLPHNVPGAPADPFLTAAIYSEPEPDDADPPYAAPNHIVSNCIVWGNTTVTPLGVMGVDTLTPASDFEVYASDVQVSSPGVWPTGGVYAEPNLNVDPLFVDPRFGDFRLSDGGGSSSSSPCVGTGMFSASIGDAGDVNEDGDFGMTNGFEIPFAPSWTNLFFQDPMVGVDRVLGVAVPPQVSAIDMGAMERE